MWEFSCRTVWCPVRQRRRLHLRALNNCLRSLTDWQVSLFYPPIDLERLRSQVLTQCKSRGHSASRHLKIRGGGGPGSGGAGCGGSGVMCWWHVRSEKHQVTRHSTDLWRDKCKKRIRRILDIQIALTNQNEHLSLSYSVPGVSWIKKLQV